MELRLIMYKKAYLYIRKSMTYSCQISLLPIKHLGIRLTEKLLLNALGLARRPDSGIDFGYIPSCIAR